MTETKKAEDRLKWIARVALAIRLAICSGPLTYAREIGEFAEGVRLMASMSDGFIEVNNLNFGQIGESADALIKRLTNER